jgi:hypothetical protein
MSKIIRNYYKFDRPITFNILPEILINLNVTSYYKSDYKEGKILNEVFQIKHIHQHPIFNEFCNKIKKDLKVTDHWDLDMFLAFAPGSSGATHVDDYEVAILSVLGQTCFRDADGNHVLNPGDLISYKRGEIHQGIGLDPRISLSFGYGF